MNILLKMKRIKDLSPSERQVVNYVLSDPDLATQLGIAEIAQKTYTSTSTVMRVVRKLGMESFTDFRLQLAADVSEYTEMSVLYRHQEPIDKDDTIGNIIEKVTGNNVRAVLDVKKHNPLPVFEKAVDMMCTAKQLDFYGSGVSNLICHDAMIKALRVGLPSTALSYYSEMAMLARTCTPDHLGILLSYTGQTQDTLRVAEYLQRGKIPTISITSYTDNALLELCTVNLFVDSHETIYRIGGMSSRLSSLHLLDILFSAFINRNYEQLHDAIEKTFLPETFHRLGQNLDE